MHNHRIFSGGRGEFKSALTGKVYPYVPTRDSSDRRRALAEMEAADNQVREAASARAGRHLTDIQILRLKTPDTRTTRQRVNDDALHNSNESSSPLHENTRNPFEARINTLKEQLARETRPSRREGIKKRLRLAENESEQFERSLEARRDWEAKVNHPDVTTARVLADSWLVLLRTSHDPELQGLYERAQEAVQNLKDTADHAACRSTLSEIETAYEAVKTNRAKALESQAAELRTQAKAAKAEAAIKPEPEPVDQ